MFINLIYIGGLGLFFLLCIYFRNNKMKKKYNNYELDNSIKKVMDELNIDIIFISNEDEDLNSKYIVPINDSEKFVKRLVKNAKTNNHLYLIIHSHGGDIGESDIILNAIMRHNNPIYTVVPRYAKSAATLIALTGKIIFMDSYSHITPTDPQLSVKDKTFSSKMLMDFLNIVQNNKNYDGDYILEALDAKVYHDDNLKTLNKILCKKRLSKTNHNKIMNLLGSGELPHNYPFGPHDLINMGLNVQVNVPDELTEICKLYLKKIII